MHQVLSVDKGSLAARYGILPGDFIKAINGEPLIDAIDYQALTAVRHVCLVVEKQDGSSREVDILKPPHAPLGIQFEDSLVCDPRSCANNCVFCFVDQMPKGMRSSLYIKDDDWRLSLMMGNFVTLTNVSDREFERIVRRKASPLYVSVHATNPQVRSMMLRQKRAAGLMTRLNRLKEEGLQFHCQVVLCPGMNDGDVLEETLAALLDLHPSALSVALVPVGLTKYRDNLTDISPYTASQAREVLDICHKYQDIAFSRTGKYFVYPADEFICIAGAELPGEAYYDQYPQLENGIGMIRLFEEQLKAASQEASGRTDEGTLPRVLIACGVSIAAYMQSWVEQYKPSGAQVEVRAIRNDFFGHSVTVSGLITGLDLAQQTKGIEADLLLLPDSMLNSSKELFLDNFSLGDLSSVLGYPVCALPCTGDALLSALQNPQALITSFVTRKEQA